MYSRVGRQGPRSHHRIDRSNADRRGHIKLFKPTIFNVIVLIPAAVVAARNVAYATAPETRPEPPTAEQIEETIAGKTMKAADEEGYAFVDADGTLKGSTSPVVQPLASGG